MVLSLDPKKKKKRNPSKLKPLEPATNRKGKITGNFAAEVLARLEEQDRNKGMGKQMKQLDKEIDSFLNFNQNELK
jgi:hypothetical protein